MKKTFFILISILFAATLATANPPATYGQELTIGELWSLPMEVWDLAVSKDGNYIAVVNGSFLCYFEVDNLNPLWWFEQASESDLISVAISADGKYVVAGTDDGYIAYFADAQTLTGNVADATWWSIDLGGPVEPGTLDISDNGEYVVVGGTGANLYYFADCTSRTGINQDCTWCYYLEIDDYSVDVYAVDMSSDGKYVVVGGWTDSMLEGFSSIL